MNDLNFSEDLSIDLDDLHEEFRKHAAMRYKYACEISELDQKAKKAHEKVKVERSNLIKYAHSNSKELFDKPKPTSPEVESYYRTHPSHINAKNELIESEYDLSMAYNAVHAFNDRKTALENAVKLYLNNYFATPREERPVEAGKLIIDTNREKTQVSQRKTLNKDKSENTEISQKTTRRRRK